MARQIGTNEKSVTETISIDTDIYGMVVNKGVIRVGENKMYRPCVSPEKKNGKFRLIFNLKPLNRYIQ